jgi:hypothetical protein
MRSMEHQGTTVRLASGEQVALDPVRAARVYDELWLLAKHKKGAIAAAAKLKHATEWTRLHGEDTLNDEETEAFRAALGRADR